MPISISYDRVWASCAWVAAWVSEYASAGVSRVSTTAPVATVAPTTSPAATQRPRRRGRRVGLEDTSTHVVGRVGVGRARVWPANGIDIGDDERVGGGNEGSEGAGIDGCVGAGGGSTGTSIARIMGVCGRDVMSRSVKNECPSARSLVDGSASPHPVFGVACATG